jgi:carbohydrate binding domain protein
VFTFSSCSDVPAPYDILGEGDVPGLTGDGTKENPYSIEAAQQKQDGTIAWVQGYIVGTVENYEDPSGSAKFAAPFTAKNNLLIAASATETNVKNCVCVQLSSGTELYSKLNLAENATNLGHILAIQGSLEKFYGFPGVKSTTAATLDGKDVGGSGETDPDNPLGLDDSNPVNSFSATFDDAVNNNDYLLANWYNVAVAGGRRWQGKIFNNTDKYIQATSYNASGSNFECWFVTPAFKVDEIADKTVSFKCAVYNYATAAANSNLEVYFLKLVNGKMESSKLTIDGMPTTDNTWVPLEAKLDSYAGQTGFVGFKYTSTSSTEALSYRLDDIQAGKGQGGGETPGEGTELLTNGGFENWADGYPTGWKSASTASSATLEQSTDKRSGASSVLVKGDPQSNKRLGSTEMTLKAGTYTFSAYLKAATAGSTASAALGYVPIGDDGVIGGNDYKYGDYANDLTNADWVVKSYTFTLLEQKKICLLVMNSKKPGGNLLVDDASLKTTDGGIVDGGGVDPEPDPELDPYESNIAMPTTSDSKVDFYYNCTVNEFASLKLGKNGVAGTWTSDALGTVKTKLSFYSVAWSGKNGTSLTVEIVGGGTFEGGEASKTVSLIANTGFSGSGTAFTIVPVTDTDYHEYTLIGITANSKIKFSTDKERGAVFGVKLK